VIGLPSFFLYRAMVSSTALVSLRSARSASALGFFSYAVTVFGALLFLLGVGEGFEYLVVVGCIVGRVAQDGLASVWSCVVNLLSRIEHRPPKSVVVGSNPTPPATDKPSPVLRNYF